MRALGSVPGVTLVSLQRPVLEADQAAFADLGLVDFSPELTDFLETVALMANLDLVISVDSAVAHLAGAIGMPVWSLIYEPANWRWMTKREDSPWYPTMRLFRQKRAGEWDVPMAMVVDALGKVADGAGSAG